MMTKIIAELEADNHKYLTAYKLEHGYSTLEKALNAWMTEIRQKSQLFR
jgi:hypothetical protein